MLLRVPVLLLLLITLPVSGTEPLRLTADPSCPYVCPDTVDPSRLAGEPGIIYEILDAILSHRGYRLQFEFLPYRRGLTSVRVGEHDALMVTLRDDAPSLLYHRTPIASARGCFVARSDNDWQYNGISSLENIRFGGTLGYKYGPLKSYIESNRPNTLMMAGDKTFDRLLHMVEIDRLDATIEDINVINYRLKQLQLTGTLRVAGCLPPRVPLYVGISPGYPAAKRLSTLIDLGISELDRSGKMQQISEKYGLVYERKPERHHP